jgi:hypothetical protein
MCSGVGEAKVPLSEPVRQVTACTDGYATLRGTADIRFLSEMTGILGAVGALVTLDLPADAPALTMPWIITFGPLRDEDEWEPVVCGPYERPHALALAESVVADQDLMAVVEPLQPHTSVERIRDDIAAARLAAEHEDLETAALDAEFGYDDELLGFPSEAEPSEPTPAPSLDELRAGFARIAAKLTA